MQTLSTFVKSTFTIKKSKFLCFCYPIQNKEEVKEIIEDLKSNYSDASHICYAYILDDNSYYCTDGGEPSGTAGKPILSAIKANRLNYTLVVVVRYFGGIKFGPGPLRSTFKTVSAQTLKLTNKVECSIMDIIRVHVPYDKFKTFSFKFKNNIYRKIFKKEYIEVDILGMENQISPILSSFKINILDIKKNQLIK